jgi:hypothetical protein
MKRNNSGIWLCALALVGLCIATVGGTAAAQDAQEKKAIAVTTGTFRKVAHNTSGSVTIYELPNGTRELRISNLNTASGPALHVYLVKAEDVKDSQSVKRAGFIDLGKLQKQKGDSVYRVPADIDLWQYLSVTIWCQKFSVNFGTAPLKAAGR